MAARKDSPFTQVFEAMQTEGLKFWEDFQAWASDLSPGEQVILLCGFTTFLMYLIVTSARKDKNPGGTERQFTGALMVVIVVAFGATWVLDGGETGLVRFFQTLGERL